MLGFNSVVKLGSVLLTLHSVAIKGKSNAFCQIDTVESIFFSLTPQ